jgi:FkbM family methyltransferase
MFEPVPEFFELLEKNRESFGATNAHLVNRALTDVDGADLALRVDLENAGRVIFFNDSYSVTVRTSTLDSCFPREEIAFLKVDTDGSELKVLDGGRELIRRSRPDIYIEFHPKVMRSEGVEPAVLLDRLFGLGMEIFDVYDPYGSFVETSSSRGRILELAERAEFYIDLLGRCGSE